MPIDVPVAAHRRRHARIALPAFDVRAALPDEGMEIGPSGRTPTPGRVGAPYDGHPASDTGRCLPVTCRGRVRARIRGRRRHRSGSRHRGDPLLGYLPARHLRPAHGRSVPAPQTTPPRVDVESDRTGRHRAAPRRRDRVRIDLHAVDVRAAARSRAATARHAGRVAPLETRRLHPQGDGARQRLLPPRDVHGRDGHRDRRKRRQDHDQRTPEVRARRPLPVRDARAREYRDGRGVVDCESRAREIGQTPADRGDGRVPERRDRVARENRPTDRRRRHRAGQ